MWGKCKRRGWVLLEIIIVVVMGLALLSITAIKGVEFLDSGREARAYSEVAAIGVAISEYNVELGVYPENINNLTMKNGQYGPWLKKIESDPWGNAYIYVKSEDGFAVYSCGKNQVDDGSNINLIANGDIGFIGK